MTIFDFIALTNDEQLDTVLTTGVFLSSRRNAVHRITLYSINDFYVEVYFQLHEQQITMLSAIHGDRIEDLYHDIEPFKPRKQENKSKHNPFYSNLTFPAYFHRSLS